jgi:hypothetical protein
MGAIIMEADMPFGAYVHTSEEHVAKVKAGKYVKDANKHLATIVKKTILAAKTAELISWEELLSELIKAKFKAQDQDLTEDEK